MSLTVIREDTVDQIQVTRNTPTNPGTVGDELNRSVIYKNTKGNTVKHNYSIYLVAQVLNEDGDYARHATTADLENLPLYSDTQALNNGENTEFLEVWFEGTITITTTNLNEPVKRITTLALPWDALEHEPGDIQSNLDKMRSIIEADKWYELNR